MSAGTSDERYGKQALEIIRMTVVVSSSDATSFCRDRIRLDIFLASHGRVLRLN
jgi:hypothetical protein